MLTPGYLNLALNNPALSFIMMQRVFIRTHLTCLRGTVCMPGKTPL